jgi:hypothetical protein
MSDESESDDVAREARCAYLKLLKSATSLAEKITATAAVPDAVRVDLERHHLNLYPGDGSYDECIQGAEYHYKAHTDGGGRPDEFTVFVMAAARGELGRRLRETLGPQVKIVQADLCPCPPIIEGIDPDTNHALALTPGTAHFSCFRHSAYTSASAFGQLDALSAGSRDGGGIVVCLHYTQFYDVGELLLSLVDSGLIDNLRVDVYSLCPGQTPSSCVKISGKRSPKPYAPLDRQPTTLFLNKLTRASDSGCSLAAGVLAGRSRRAPTPRHTAQTGRTALRLRPSGS